MKNFTQFFSATVLSYCCIVASADDDGGSTIMSKAEIDASLAKLDTPLIQ